jgi:hypothetical protein
MSNTVEQSLGLSWAVVNRKRRTGWAAAADKISNRGDDALVMGDFGNETDAELVWFSQSNGETGAAAALRGGLHNPRSGVWAV